MTLDSLEVLLNRMMNRIQQPLELPAILSATVVEARVFLGTDRVKVYRFDDDASGEVVAESVDCDRLPSLLGQHFPPGDIPAEARELFLKARQRSIVDVASQSIGLSPLDCPETVEVPSRNDIRFRPVDPCHLEYLTAMGVKSSLVVPILYRNELWGLLVSHHSCPRQVSQRELQVVQLIADQLSIAIAQSSLLEESRLQTQQEATINCVARLLHSMTEMQVQQALQLTISALQSAGGRIYIAPKREKQERQLFVCGIQPIFSGELQKTTDSQPILEEYPAWQIWLEMEKRLSKEHPASVIRDVYEVSIQSDITQAFLDVGIRNLLVIPLQYRNESLRYLSIFRSEIEIETLWGRRPDRDDLRHQYPIQSFQAWRELKQNQVRDWKNREIELVSALASHFAVAIHQYELYQQVYALNANLQEDIEERKQAEKKISALNAELEGQVNERTKELKQVNIRLLKEISERERALLERELAQTSLERLNRQSELILNSAGEGIYGLNKQGKITFVNPAAAKMLGYEVPELLDRFMHEVAMHSKPDASIYFSQETPIYNTLKDGTVQHVTDDIFYRWDGSEFPVEYVSAPIR